jgi:hypothetical protein
MGMRMEFGYYPDPLDFTVGDLTIETLPDLETKRAGVEGRDGVEGDWIYAPRAKSQDILSGVIRQLPYNSRVFGLPQTHALAHATSNDREHLQFLVWMLGFIYGIPLTETEAGFLDATPIKPGKLHDIIWTGRSEPKALAIADKFWHDNAASPRVAKGLTGIVHSLFLSETRMRLDFEAFIYLYIALDGCYRVWTTIHGEPPKKSRPTHQQRIDYLCKALNRPTPDWANPMSGTVAEVRNDTLHEGLFFDEPLGFQVYFESPTDRNHLLEMRALVCRFICGIVGFGDTGYITSDIDKRQQFGIRL